MLSIFLGLVPLAGVAFTAWSGTLSTVDGLFMSLILLTLSGILFLNAFWEVKKMKKSKAPQAQR
jgi:uncharacterized membrane protein